MSRKSSRGLTAGSALPELSRMPKPLLVERCAGAAKEFHLAASHEQKCARGRYGNDPVAARRLFVELSFRSAGFLLTAAFSFDGDQVASKDGEEEIMGCCSVVLPCRFVTDAGAVVARAHVFGMVGCLFGVSSTYLVYGWRVRIRRLHSLLVGILQYCIYFLEAEQVFS